MNRPELICVGTSAGGIAAVQRLLSELPEKFPIAVAVVQHLPATADLDLPLIFGRFYSGKFFEALDKQPIESGAIYFAPADYHMQFESGGYISLSQDEPLMYSRPSIDAMFSSAAKVYGSKACGILLTGANSDGAKGLKEMSDAGAVTIVQDPLEAEARAMPDAAIALKDPNFILPITEISKLLSRFGEGAET